MMDATVLLWQLLAGGIYEDVVVLKTISRKMLKGGLSHKGRRWAAVSEQMAVWSGGNKTRKLERWNSWRRSRITRGGTTRSGGKWNGKTLERTTSWRGRTTRSGGKWNGENWSGLRAGRGRTREEDDNWEQITAEAKLSEKGGRDGGPSLGVAIIAERSSACPPRSFIYRRSWFTGGWRRCWRGWLPRRLLVSRAAAPVGAAAYTDNGR